LHFNACLAILGCIVLSIGKIALGQHRYYEQQVAQGADDYYAGRGEAAGEWVGAGADALGLSGRVGVDQFNALIAGRDPNKPSAPLRSRSAGRPPTVAALDLTFSAPKSVSVLAAVAPDEVTAELILAHEEALTAALAYLEETAVWVRRGIDGERVRPGGGLIAAAYRHRMSRALDPQLHTHVVAANLTRGPDGRYTALHGTPLYRAAKTAGFLYQAHLRALISERLGLRWGPVHRGAAELLDVPEAVLAEFSKRRHEMLREADAGGIGIDSKAAGESLAIATRDRKRYGVDTHTWREEVRARAGELGLGTREVARLGERARERLATGAVERETVDEDALSDRLVSSVGLTERANTFDERAVLQEFAAAAEAGVLVPEARAQAERFAERADVIPTVRGEMTTRELVACERRLIEAAMGRAGTGSGLVDPGLAKRELVTGSSSLTDEQAAAVRAAVASGHGVTVIEALAGTGKTFTAGALRRVYESAAYEVIGVAPTGRAARELSERAGIASRTVDRLLVDLEQLGDELPQGCVVIFDEAGMAPTRLTARLLQAAEQAGAKVIAIGDPGQLASVQAGGWLGAVGRALGAVRLTQVMRQRDPAERRALAALHDFQPDRYLAWAMKSGRIKVFAERPGACERAIEEWSDAAARVGLDHAVMIARDNETRGALNDAARELRGALGLLGEERLYGPVEVAVGDRVICRRNDRLIDVDNGMRGTVRHVGADRVVIDTDSGLVRQLPATYVSEHLQHAYALTGHGMQGGTVETGLVVASPRDLTAGWSYTALSRARGHTQLLIHDDQFAQPRSEFAPAEQARGVDRSDLLCRVQRRMLERDDEDLALEQLPPAGRASDSEVAGCRVPATELPQERAATLAEPEPPSSATPSRLRELGERIQQLQAQLEALPTRELERIEHFEERALRLSTRREQLAVQLAELPEPGRRFGHEHDPPAIERAHLTSAIEAHDRELDAVMRQRADLEREPRDPSAVKTERDGLECAIGQAARELSAVRDELVERELGAPGPLVRDTFAELPDDRWEREQWETGVRQVARDGAEHNITDPVGALEPAPETDESRDDWKEATEAIERTAQQLGREVGSEREVDLGIGF
jgi:conjugative relaxase-like TrwC/TraI family protein